MTMPGGRGSASSAGSCIRPPAGRPPNRSGCSAGRWPLVAASWNRTIRWATYYCDFVDERSRTIVEIDGREFHSEPEVFRKDRSRQNRLVLDGWLVLRYAASDVYQHLDEIANETVRVVRTRRRTRPH
jgi:very-short-patch-repair endonuclease